MLRTYTTAVATGLVVALSALVPALQAQVFPGAGPGGGMRGPGPGGMMGMGMGMGATQGGPLMLLLAPSVQKELKLKEDQKAKCYTFVQKARQKNSDMFQSRMFNGNANPQAGMMEVAKQIRKENDAGIAQILDPKQKERFDQIVLQNEGPLAVARPEIASKLRLNESQKEYVQGVMMQMGNELFMARRQSQVTGSFSPAHMREITSQLRKEAVKEISKVIDRKQQKNFNSMLGAPFDLAKLEAEAASAEDALGPAADPAKPADPAKVAETPQSKDASPAATTEAEKTTTKESTPTNSPRGSSASQPGSNP